MYELESPARASFRNLNFKSLCELSKTWKYNLSPRFKSLKAPIDELRKFIRPNLSFTAENRMENLHKAGHILNLK